jgi:hypothetical protein
MAGAGVALATSVLPGGTGERCAGATVVLHGGRDAHASLAARRFAGEGAQVVQLEADPVRQWRGAQGALLSARDTRLVGVTTWPQFLLVRGLAEESGRRVRHQRMDAAAGTISWLIS